MVRQSAHNNVNDDSVPAAVRQLLHEGVVEMNLEAKIDQQVQAALLRYASELLRWNKAYNLTAVTDLQAVVTRHLLDSLSVLPFLKPGLTVDVGTGAGLPGIPLALALPEQPFVLLDSNGKRMRFLAHIQRILSISNIELITARAEQWSTRQQIVQVVTRAFAPISRQLEWCAELIQQDTVLLAMTGKNEPAQLRNWPAGYTLRHSQALAVPGTQAARHLLEIIRA